MIVRPETPADIPSIRSVIVAAFQGAEHSSGTEVAIVDALRQAGALTLSLVAERDGMVIGHVGFSPVRIGGEDAGWYGLGPVAVATDRQRSGVGSALIEAGLDQLSSQGALGCVVLGDPAYYARFGFSSDHALRYAGVPPQYFQSLVLCGDPSRGEVTYHEGFEAG